ncbi:ABC transporter permease [Roseateles chitinivorans]|uniref:ABC transporter permease n=1 Tax=Roseateles chitinivorans TaxID=2917965 RepID=UPI003D675F30
MKFLKNLGLVLLLVLVLVAWVMLPWFGALGLAVLLALWMFLTRRGAQARSVTGVGVSTLPQRIGSSAVIVVGIAGVVGVLVALLAMAEGYSETLRKSGSEDTAIVLRGASAAEVASVMTRDDITQISQAPGVAKSAKGEPLLSAETVVAANLPVKGTKTDEEGSVQMRGVGDEAFAVRPQVRIVAGRKFQPGLKELIVGQGAARQFEGLEPGKQIRLGSQMWTVTGVFASGDSMESELWADAPVVAETYRRGASRNSVTVKLTDAKAFKEFKAALEANPQLKVDATTTLAFFAKQSEQMTKILRIIGIVVGSIMAVGAVFGALNTMFAAVATRAREIATLRAIGFPGLPVVVAVMLETMLLAAVGGVIGGGIAYLIFNGHAASTMAAGSVGKLSFELRVSGQLLWEGLKWALAIGFIGGLFPAVRAASLPVTTALREL